MRFYRCPACLKCGIKFRTHTKRAVLDNNLCVAHIEARLSFDVKALIPYTQDQTTQIHHSFIINNQILVGEAEKIMLEIEEFNAVSAKLLTNYVLRYKQKTLSKYPEVKHHYGE